MRQNTVPGSPAQSSGMMRALSVGAMAWLQEQIPWILHVIKLLIAIMLAMGVSMLFDLSKPGTAMITVTIVMQPRAGVVTSKAFYRFLGTFVGSVVSMILACLFNQDALLFFIFGACWIGFCTAGSTLFRNFQSYGFVLAGYTLLIVGLPGALAPENLFDIATTRLAEVSVGLICATFISEIIFPLRLSDAVIATVRTQFTQLAQSMQRQDADAGGNLRGLSRPAAPPIEREQQVLQLLGQVISLETMRTSAVFEHATGHAHNTLIRRYNGAFALVSTTFHALDQLFIRLQQRQAFETLDALLAEYSAMIGLLSESDDNGIVLAQHSQQISVRLQQIRLDFATANDNASTSQTDLMDFDTAADLLERFCRELRLLVRIQYAIVHAEYVNEEEFAASIPLNRKILARTDRMTVAMGALRAVLSFLATYVFWLYSGWTSGVDAVVMGTVVCALFASSPRPTAAVLQFFIGALIGSAMGVGYAGFILPHAENLQMVAIGLTPFIIIGGWLSMIPRFSGIGLGILLFVMSYSGVEDSFNVDILALVNGSIGGIGGVVIAGVLFILIDPSDSDWSKHRLARALRRRVVLACREPIADALTSLNASTRDLMGRFVALGPTLIQANNPADRQLLLWLLSVMEVGRATIHLREQAFQSAEQASQVAINDVVLQISRLFSRPGAHRLRQTLASIHDAMQTEGLSRTAMTNLHLIRMTLTERISVLHPDQPADTATVATPGDTAIDDIDPSTADTTPLDKGK